MSAPEKFAADLEVILETIKQERMGLMNGSYPEETLALIRERLQYLANEAKTLNTELDRIDRAAK